MAGLLWGIISLLVLVWIVSFLAFHVTGGLIHLLLVAAVILVVVNLFTGRGARV